MTQPKGFAPLIIMVVMAVVIAGGAATVYYAKGQASPSKHRNESVATHTAATTNNVSQKLTHYSLPTGWRVSAADGIYPVIAYPSAYGDFSSVAKGGGRYVDGEYMTATPATPPFTGLEGGFIYTRYTDSQPVLMSRKYGPDIQLIHGVWTVVATPSYLFPPNAYRVGDTYTEVTKTISQAGVTVYTLKSEDEGVIKDTIAFAMNGRMYSVALPSVELGVYGPAATDAYVMSRSVAYDGFVSQVVDSVSTLPK